MTDTIAADAAGMSEATPSTGVTWRDWRDLALSAGPFLLTGAVGFGVAATWSPADPAWNVAASGAPIQNMFGAPGAIAADLAWQGLGFGAVLGPLAIGAFGVRRLADFFDWPLFLRPGLLSGAALLTLPVLSAAAPVAAWPNAFGNGGGLGDALGAGMTAFCGFVRLPGPQFWAIGALAAAAAGLWIKGFGLHFADLGKGAAAIALAARKAAGAIRARGPAASKALARTARSPAAAPAPNPAEPPADRPSLRSESAILRANFAPKVDRPTWERLETPPHQSAGLEGDNADLDGDDAAAIAAHFAPPDAAPATAIAKAAPAKPAAAPPKLAKKPPVGPYRGPTLDLLAPPTARSEGADDAALLERARLLQEVLTDFNVKGDIVEVRPGPVVTLFELEPAPGTRSSRIVGLADDIARSMSAISARVAVIPGRNAVGIELPNDRRETVFFRTQLVDKTFEDPKIALPVALGETIGGEPFIADLARMPHLLIAGTTGSGKSVGINAIILSLLYRLAPEQCRMIMIDPKKLELSSYQGIPHLLTPVVTEARQAVGALKWAVVEMEERYRKMARVGVRNIAGYNQKMQDALKAGQQVERTVQTGIDENGDPILSSEYFTPEMLPYIVIVIDEMADLMVVAGKEIESLVQRLAQMARAAGLHLVMATQRPSVDVITGVIKANFPTRVSYQVTSKIDSRTILGEMGAEQLLGQGDLLFMAGGGRITRLHGPFVSDSEVERVADALRRNGPPAYAKDVAKAIEEADRDPDAEGDEDSDLFGGAEDDDYRRAVQIVLRDRKVSTSYIQRRMQIGYNRAASLIERMERDGIISPPDHTNKRRILRDDGEPA